MIWSEPLSVDSSSAVDRQRFTPAQISLAAATDPTEEFASSHTDTQVFEHVVRCLL